MGLYSQVNMATLYAAVVYGVLGAVVGEQLGGNMQKRKIIKAREMLTDIIIREDDAAFGASIEANRDPPGYSGCCIVDPEITDKTEPNVDLEKLILVDDLLLVLNILE